MNGNNESTQGKQFRVLDFEPDCPDCAVAVGEPHEYDEYDGGCDVARCLVTGLQRLMCDLDHDCGRDVWTGWWPGQLFSELATTTLSDKTGPRGTPVAPPPMEAFASATMAGPS